MKVASCYLPITCELGEGPVYDYRSQTLYWVDITQGLLYQKDVNGDSLSIHKFDQPIGFAIPTQLSSKIVIGLRDGVFFYNLDDELKTVISEVEIENLKNRLNDGKCDSEGRLWMGTMGLKAEKNVGSLYSLTQGKLDKHLDKLTISNGMAWYQNKFYFIDSVTQSIREFRYDVKSGAIENPKVIIKIPSNLGTPDGMTIDCNNNLWVALWGGKSVICVDTANGEIIDQIHVPAPNVTSCCFGGVKFDTLFITTARQDLSQNQINDFPESGSVFSIKPGVNGVTSNFYKK